jgi:hypothetical protein
LGGGKGPAADQNAADRNQQQGSDVASLTSAEDAEYKCEHGDNRAV